MEHIKFFISLIVTVIGASVLVYAVAYAAQTSQCNEYRTNGVRAEVIAKVCKGF